PCGRGRTWNRRVSWPAVSSCKPLADRPRPRYAKLSWKEFSAGVRRKPPLTPSFGPPTLLPAHKTPLRAKQIPPRADAKAGNDWVVLAGDPDREGGLGQ